VIHRGPGSASDQILSLDLTGGFGNSVNVGPDCVSASMSRCGFPVVAIVVRACKKQAVR
jgi:hypothetical protein